MKPESVKMDWSDHLWPVFGWIQVELHYTEKAKNNTGELLRDLVPTI